jgi:dTDP-6-deoxy-L-talose 4-dehydrogenase (NAD+)
MRVAVTGASGFVGRHVVRALRSRGVEVIALSRTPPACVESGVVYAPLDLAAVGSDAFARIGEPDVLLHLAWGGLPNYRSNTHLDRELPMQARFLEQALRGGLRRVVVTGTCLEYGMREGELDESMAVAPRVPYAQAKDALHRRLHMLRDELGFGLGWLRLFYLYGEGQAPTSLYRQLQAAIESGARRFAMSPGDQVRDFLAIEVAAGMLADLATGPVDADVANVCSGRPVTIAAIVRGWLREWGADLELDLGALPYADHEPFAFWGSTRRLDALLETR